MNGSSIKYNCMYTVHVAQDYNMGVEDMRRLMEGEMREIEEKLRTAAKKDR